VVEPPPPPPPSEPDVPPVGPPPPQPGICPRCGAPRDPFQEYCLECGHRLPPPFGTGGMRRTEMWSRESPLWLWAALASLLLVALVAGAVVAIAATRGDKEGKPRTSIPVVTTGPGTTETVGIVTQPPTITITPPSTTFGTTTLATTTKSSTTTFGTTTTSANVTWPAGKDGFTIVLKSVPTSQGRGPADAAAQKARNNGLSQVGVLNSSDYSSLNPGYWVTFSGIYDTRQQAETALPNARGRGFPLAYSREVKK
jgi:hypothetical protein